MNTHPRRYLLPLCCCAAVVLSVACATSRESLRTSASRLDDVSSRFSSQLQYQGDDNRRGLVSRDAETLARAAHNFDRALNKGDSRDSVDADYHRVMDGYDQLHSQLADAGYAGQNRQVLEGFDRVTAAYRDVEAGMGRR